MRITSISWTVGEQDHALTDIDEHANRATAFRHMLIAATFRFALQTAIGLRAKNLSTKEAKSGVDNLFAGSRAPVLECLFREDVIIPGQSHKFEDGWM